MKKLKALKKFVSKGSTSSDESNTKKTHSLNHHSSSFLVPVDYTMPSILENYVSNFHNKVDEFAQKCNIDEFNANMLDDDIESILQLSIDDLDRQRINHKETLAKLRIYQEVELSEMRSKLASLEQERAEKQQLLDRLTEKRRVSDE